MSYTQKNAEEITNLSLMVSLKLHKKVLSGEDL
jgi:hypothetical protein